MPDLVDLEPFGYAAQPADVTELIAEDRALRKLVRAVGRAANLGVKGGAAYVGDSGHTQHRVWLTPDQAALLAAVVDGRDE